MIYGKSDEELATEPLSFQADLLKDKIVIVSGAGRGIGAAIAFRLARHGAKLAICGRNLERLEDKAEKLRKLGAEVLVRQATIRDPDAVSAFVDEVWQHFGHVDVLVNNAGGQFSQAAIDFSPKGWNAVIETNLTGTWYMMQACARKWRDAGMPGNIVNIVASIWRGTPGIAHTCAARAGVIYLSKTLAVEWAPLKIRVNCVAPGIIATEGMKGYPEEARRALPMSNLLHRFGNPTEIADAVCFVAGPTGTFMNGAELVLDGGTQVYGDLWTIPEPAWFRTPPKDGL